uniref:Pecanex-like protein n=1 Tax=Macrostomum lignano TaxID=282301 RepID=A0A1I8GM17_9PLAT
VAGSLSTRNPQYQHYHQQQHSGGHHRHRRQSADQSPLPLFVEVPGQSLSPPTDAGVAVAVRYRTQSEFRAQLSVPSGFDYSSSSRRWSRQRADRSRTTSSSNHSSLSGPDTMIGSGAQGSSIFGRQAASSTSDRGDGVVGGGGGVEDIADLAEIIGGPFSSSNGSRKRTRTRSFRGIESFSPANVNAAIQAGNIRYMYRYSSLIKSIKYETCCNYLYLLLASVNIENQ